MIQPPTSTDRCSLQHSHSERARFGTRDLLTATLLSSIAFASQPLVGWEAAVSMTCAALALVMGWGFLAIIGSIAALSLTCYQPQPVPAASVCFAALMAIALGPLVVHKLNRFFID